MEQPQAFTCPYCGRMGYTEMSLQEHVAADHTETSTEVVRCCSAQTAVQHNLPPFTGLLSPPPLARSAPYVRRCPAETRTM